MTEQIKIDLEWAGVSEQRPGWDSSSIETSIRFDVMQQVMLKIAVKPLVKTEREDHFRNRPLALDVMAYRSHDAILVSARRGDGKTTFLTDILRLLQQGPDTYREILPDRVKKSQVAALYPLGIVDPTLIETKQNIVVIVIEKIEMAVKRVYRLNETAKKGEYEDFRRALHELATGLTLLDGIGDSALHGKDWADADYILERGLEKARSAGAFERAFHLFLEIACDFVRVDAFVLAIDDVDTSFDRGWPVLEALRKYFATPRLKVILAGDIRLYNLLVRQQQWKQISRDFFEIEQKIGVSQSYADQLSSMVGRLQDQYLVKLVRPENRVMLAPLLRYANNGEILLQVLRSDPGASLPENTFMRRYARRLLGIRALEDRALIRAALLRLPLRSFVQVLVGAWDLCAPDKIVPRGARRQALAALSSVVSTDFLTLDLGEYDLEDPAPHRVLAALSRWLTTKGFWIKFSRFHPEGSSDTDDLVAMGVAAQMIDLFRRNPQTMIDYWLRICVIREKIDRNEIVSGSRSQIKERMKDDNTVDVQALMDHLNAETVERSTQFASRLAAWDAARGRQIDRAIRLSGAVVPSVSRLREIQSVSFDLYGLRSAVFQRDVFRDIAQGGTDEEKRLLVSALSPPLRGFHRALIDANWSYSSSRGEEAGFTTIFANTLDTLRAGLDINASAVAMIPALRLVSGQGAENGVYSVLRLIAAVAEIMGLERTDNRARNLNALSNLITTLAASRNYPTPGILSGVRQTAADDNHDELAEDFEDDAVSSNGTSLPDNASVFDAVSTSSDTFVLPDMLLNWLESLSSKNNLGLIAPVTLSRIWTRFTYAFEDITGQLVHARTRYLGVLVHRAIIAFLHAIGVETLRAAGHSLGAKIIDNPIRSSNSFLQLLKVMNSLRKKDEDPNIRFFWVIFSCPIWGYYIARNEFDITGKMDRENATEEIFQQYLNSDPEKPLNRSHYNVTFTHNSQSATFDGLYFLLNSVHLQGLTSTKKDVSGNGDELRKVLDGFKAPAPKRTRRRRKISPSPSDAEV